MKSRSELESILNKISILPLLKFQDLYFNGAKGTVKTLVSFC